MQEDLTLVIRGGIFLTDTCISVFALNLAELGGSKFHHVSCNRMSRRKSTVEGRNGYAKTRIVDFPRGDSYIYRGGGGGWILLYSHFPVGNSAMEIQSFFQGEKLLGGKDTLLQVHLLCSPPLFFLFFHRTVFLSATHRI